MGLDVTYLLIALEYLSDERAPAVAGYGILCPV